jgi:hypothetical protein
MDNEIYGCLAVVFTIALSIMIISAAIAFAAWILP